MTTPKNTHGGRRAGAGRPPRPPALNDIADPIELLGAIARGELIPSVAQLQAAIALARLQAKPGKREAARQRSAQAAAGRFGAAAAPLTVIK